MDNRSFLRMVEEQLDLEKGIMESKGHDYTIGNQDRHYNFKIVGELLDIPPEKVLMVYFLKHVLSLLNVVAGGQESEPIAGRIADGRNYLLLLRGLLDERQGDENDG